MKKLPGLLASFALLFLVSCSGEKKSNAGRPQIINGSNEPVKDSVVFYDANIKTKQKSYKKEMVGTWNVISMRRQSKAELETLQNVKLTFGADSSFSGKAPCNNMGGVYTLKGTSIQFSKVYATKMACDRLEIEGAFLQLLENRIANYAVDGNKLNLLDVSGNIVFVCERAIG
jgi:heat shock protein HslJ